MPRASATSGRSAVAARGIEADGGEHRGAGSRSRGAPTARVRGVRDTRGAARGDPPAARPTRRADRIITLALVVYGFITVLSAVPQLWHFDEFAQTWMTLAGIDATFTNTAAGDLWGRIGAAVFAIGWLITALLSWRSVIRGRLSWWIPLVGAIATFVLVSVCLTVPLLGDPAVVAHFGR